MNFSNLVKNTTRSEDSYINATAWCREFGTEWAQFSRLADFKSYLKALQSDMQFSHITLVEAYMHLELKLYVESFDKILRLGYH